MEIFTTGPHKWYSAIFHELDIPGLHGMRTYWYVNTLYNSYSNFGMYVPFVKSVKDCLKFVLDKADYSV